MHPIKKFFLRIWFDRVEHTTRGPCPGRLRTFCPSLEILEERSLLDAGAPGLIVTNANLMANNSTAMMATPMQMSSGMMATPMQMSSGMSQPAIGMMRLQIDTVFANFDSMLLSLESMLVSRIPQLDGAIQSFNAAVTMVESAVAGHPVSDLSGKL